MILERPAVTMAVESSKEVLRKAGLTGEDIDLLIYSTQVPEHSLPMNALFVHQAIKGKTGCWLMT